MRSVTLRLPAGYVTMPEAAKLLGTSKPRLCAYVRAGRLTAVRCVTPWGAKHTVFKRAQVLAMERRGTGGRPKATPTPVSGWEPWPALVCPKCGVCGAVSSRDLDTGGHADYEFRCRLCGHGWRRDGDDG